MTCVQPGYSYEGKEMSIESEEFSDLVGKHVVAFHGDGFKKMLDYCNARIKEARKEERLRCLTACKKEEIEDPEDDFDTAYNGAVFDCINAIRYLPEEG